MADITNYKIFKNNTFEVLTDEGFKDFKGIIVGTNENKIKFTLSNGKELVCTSKHKIIKNNTYEWVYAKDIKKGDVLFSGIKVNTVDVYTNNEPVYELLEVKDNHRYFANDILSHQCLILDELAFIDNHMVQDFWKSVYPIISSSKKSKIFVASTPNGTGNLFHELYTGALEPDPEKHNGWHAEKVDWWEVPGRDEKWKKNTIRELGSRDAFDQEFGNVFLETGESAVNEHLFDELKTECAEPTFVFDEGHYLLWEEPNQEKIYVAGVDISEGVSEAASVVQILDITDLRSIKQVAEYHNRNISPINFTTKLYEILQHWGNPLALIERNNCGAQVVDQLKQTHQYENIVSYGAKAGKLAFNKPGVIAHTNTKYKGVTNMRYWVNELKCLKIRNLNTLNELKNFVRYPNGTWAARPGASNWDDRVMSLIWALMILDDEIVEKYFEIEQYDDNKKPLKLRPLDYGIKYFVNPTSIYSNERSNGDASMPLPILFPADDSNEFSEVKDLESQGWQFFNNSQY